MNQKKNPQKDNAPTESLPRFAARALGKEVVQMDSIASAGALSILGDSENGKPQSAATKEHPDRSSGSVRTLGTDEREANRAWNGGEDNDEITDPKLLARVRRLIIAEHAGFVRSGYGKVANACIEPECSCNFDVSGPFRDPPVRCTSFEERVLPLDPDLEAAYWRHIKDGESMVVRRCAWPRCRREVAGVGPAAKWCVWHSEAARKKTRRESYHRRRGLDKLASAALDNQGPQKANPQKATPSTFPMTAASSDGLGGDR